jgi:ribonuclease HI
VGRGDRRRIRRGRVYKVKHEGLRPLHGQARRLAHRIGQVDFEHVRRELNARADTLANQAMDSMTRS